MSSLDEQISDIEERIQARRAELVLVTEESKERIRSIIAKPQTLLLAVALGFVVARLARPPVRVQPALGASQSRFGRLARGALRSGVTRMLPLAMGPLQGFAMQWLARRFH